MLSDEEKKAIEELKNKKADYFMISDLTGKTLLNLIEKQSKEIEELKDTRSIFNMGRRSYKNEIENKIKEFIKEELPDDEICECCDIFDVNGIEIKQKLQSLLEKE